MAVKCYCVFFFVTICCQDRLSSELSGIESYHSKTFFALFIGILLEYYLEYCVMLFVFLAFFLLSSRFVFDAVSYVLD